MSEFQLVASDLTREYRVTDLKAEYIVQGFRAVIDPAVIPKWEDASAAIVVSDESQIEQMAAARELRLSIRQTRIASENTRKALKEDALQEGKAIDGLGRAIRERLESMETHLLAQEEYAKRVAEERERVRREKADALLREQEAREAAEREAARAAEEQRVRDENERLRKEAAQREAEIEAERALQAEAQAKRDAEIRAQAEATRKAHAAELAKQEAEHRRRLENERREIARLAAMVVCPDCGAEFDSRGRHVEDLRP